MVKAILRLIRWPNLLMVPLTMYLVRYCVIAPMLNCQYSLQLGTEVSLQLSDGYFLILVLINMLLGAGGYIINDYFDCRIDNINRPADVIVGRLISRRIAITLHIVTSAAAVVLAAILSMHLHMLSLLLIYITFGGIFWLYSTTYKRQFLIGNIVVAALTASVPLQVGIIDYICLMRTYGFDIMVKGLSLMPIIYWTLGFAGFAFIISMIREIIKDMEDLEGDRAYGCNTLPISFGMQVSKIVVVSLIGITIAAIYVVYSIFLHEPLTLIYITAFIVIPLVAAAIMTAIASQLKHYHHISILLKMIMLTGILYTLIVWQIMEFVI